MINVEIRENIKKVCFLILMYNSLILENSRASSLLK